MGCKGVGGGVELRKSRDCVRMFLFWGGGRSYVQ